MENCHDMPCIVELNCDDSTVILENAGKLFLKDYIKRVDKHNIILRHPKNILLKSGSSVFKVQLLGVVPSALTINCLNSLYFDIITEEKFEV